MWRSAGKAGGSMDAANILKPALARGAIRVIGATTIKEYRQSIEKDGALERRFQSAIILTSNLGAGQMRRKMGFGMEQEGAGQDAQYGLLSQGDRSGTGRPRCCEGGC
jgi:ATP-dependent Clp protease ATP-binding subunit ClpA